MLKDAGRQSQRNSQIMSEDFDIFSSPIFEPEARKDVEQKPAVVETGHDIKRFSTHLLPSDALINTSGRYPRLRQARSMETLSSHCSPQEEGFLTRSGVKEEEVNMETVNPWEEDEKLSGITFTMKIIVIGDAGVGKTSLIHQLTKKR